MKKDGILRRINEIYREHIDNNFHPLPLRYIGEFEMIQSRIRTMFTDVLDMMETASPEAVTMLLRNCDEIKDVLSETYHRLFTQLREGDSSAMTWSMYISICFRKRRSWYPV